MSPCQISVWCIQFRLYASYVFSEPTFLCHSVFEEGMHAGMDVSLKLIERETLRVQMNLNG